MRLIAAIVVLSLFGLGAALGVGVVRRIRRQIDGARIRDGDNLRPLNYGERIVLARHLAWQRGPWFWPIVLSGIAAVLICGLILWRLGYIGHL